MFLNQLHWQMKEEKEPGKGSRETWMTASITETEDEINGLKRKVAPQEDKTGKGKACDYKSGTEQREEGRNTWTQQIRPNPLTLMTWSGGISVSAHGTWRKTWAGRSGPWLCSTDARNPLLGTRIGIPLRTAPDTSLHCGTRLEHTCPADDQTRSGHLRVRTGSFH